MIVEDDKLRGKQQQHIKSRRKLIEVALPLDAISKASGREKSIRNGHPSTLHLWWSRKPLATARAILFAQLVDDPSSCPEVFSSPVEQNRERQRLFRLIEKLVQWENSNDADVLKEARDEILKSWHRACIDNADNLNTPPLFDSTHLPVFCDPFCGGGSLPLEAQRLGLEADASDLNPVAVLINKAMIEIPLKFSSQAARNPDAHANRGMIHANWQRSVGLADDIRYYGKWLRDEAQRRIGQLYPKYTITPELVKKRPDLNNLLGKNLDVIAWLWVRTVRSPNPAFANVEVPLAPTFVLSTKGDTIAFARPVIKGHHYEFSVEVGEPSDINDLSNGTSLSRGNFRCLFSGTPIPYAYIDAEANAGRMGARLMAVVAEGERGRVYLPPTRDMEYTASAPVAVWKPDAPSRGTWASNAQGRRYGFQTFGDYFTNRQLAVLTTFSDLIIEARSKIRNDAIAAGVSDDGRGLREGGSAATAYAEAVAVYLACALSKLINIGSSLASWMNDRGAFRETFARQGIVMSWGFAEANPFSSAGGSISTIIDKCAMAVEALPADGVASASQRDAASENIPVGCIVSTDPPYYDNVGYADLSDFFYVWLRRSLKDMFPELFGTMTVPKAQELMASAYRHRSKAEAERFFLDGMTRAMHNIARGAHPAYPVTLYYAFKQADTEDDIGTASTGWETFLDALIEAGFRITGTWPIRTESSGRIGANKANSLSSSIVLVCRTRDGEYPTATRREFATALKSELPTALAHLQRENIAPADLAQAAIGPGMSVFTRYLKVLDADGRPVGVRGALAMINEVLDQVLAEQEGDFDPETRFAIAWFDQNGFGEGDFGSADVLARAKNTTVSRLVDARIAGARSGKLWLRKPDSLDHDWELKPHGTVWEITHQLVRALNTAGEDAAAALVRKIGSGAEVARELAYRLYIIAERKKRANDALSYNTLVQSWPEIVRLSLMLGNGGDQPGLFGGR